MVAEGTVVEEFRVEHRVEARADLLLELRLEEAPALLLEQALTAPVAPVLTARVHDTARLTAPDTAHLTALALPPTKQDLVPPRAQFSSHRKQHLQEEVVMEAGAIEGLRVHMTLNTKDLVHIITPSQRLPQVPGVVR